MRHRHAGIDGDRLRRRKGLEHIEYWSRRNLGSLQTLEPVGRCRRREPRGDQRHELVTPLDAIAIGSEARVGGQVREPDGVAEARPLTLTADANGNGSVGRGECLVRNDVRVGVAATPWRPAGHERVLGLVREDGERALENRDIDPLAIGARPRDEPRKHRDGPEHPGDNVADGNADLRGHAIGVAGDRHQAAAGLDDEVVAGLAGIGTADAVTADGDMHEIRVQSLQGILVEPEAGKAARAEVLDEHVPPADELPQHLAAGVRVKIEPEAPLVAIDGQEIRGRTGASCRIADPRWSPTPRRIAFGRLDLDDLRTEVGQEHRAVRPGQDGRTIEDAQSVEWSGRNGRGSHGRDGTAVADGRAPNPAQPAALALRPARA